MADGSLYRGRGYVCWYIRMGMGSIVKSDTSLAIKFFLYSFPIANFYWQMTWDSFEW